jgi:hypothetical protein
VTSVPYPKKLLNDYETVALDLHPHWWHFAEPALALVATIVLGVVALAVDAESYLKYVVLALILLCAGWLLVRFVQWAATA